MRTHYEFRSPLGALLSGLVAGAIGSLAQSLFLSATKKLAPANPEHAFAAPEPQQREETPTQTVARRFVEGFMARPIAHKELGGQLIHYGFGAAWGGVYGLVHGPRPSWRGPLGALAFSTLVWGVSENLILPAFKIAAWPQAYPPKVHAYALAAHFAYGAAVWGAYELMRPSMLGSIAAFLSAAWITRALPSSVRAPARKALATAGIGRARASRFIDAMQSM
jgi:hypothetical protein